jgi:hypothetical protein
MNECWPADDFADAVEAERAAREAIQIPLLDPRGVTSQKPFELIERERWEAGMDLSEKLTLGGMHEEAAAFKSCHSYQTVMVCAGCSKVSRFWNRCDILFCPQCSPVLAKKRLEGLMFFVEKMVQTKHIVLTFKNVTRLTADYISDCKKKLGQFRRRKFFAGAKGGMWAMEITNNGNGWHLHFHLVVDVPWLDVRQLSAEWQRVCGDGSRIVWIEDATRGGLKANLPRYISKYASKGFRPQDWSGEQFCEFVRAMAGGRSFGVFGNLMGARKEWQAWLAEFVRTKKTCECGSCLKSFYTPQEWEFVLMQREARAERQNLPPPIVDRQMFLPVAV